MCHTRVMPDGSVVKGAQGNLPFDRAIAWDTKQQSVTPENDVVSRPPQLALGSGTGCAVLGPGRLAESLLIRGQDVGRFMEHFAHEPPDQVCLRIVTVEGGTSMTRYVSVIEPT